MSYQKCPVCKGSGKKQVTLTTTVKCPVCKGTGIINEFTGQPPNVSDEQNNLS